MRRSLLLAAVALGCAVPAGAADGVDLTLRSKAIVKSSSAGRFPAPFVAGGRDPLPQLLLHEEQRRRGPRGQCTGSATDLCYDLAEGRIVYRPARRYMPRIDGLTAESISLRRDRIVLKYSF